LAEGFLDGGEIGVNVRVIELDVVEDDQFREIMEELAALVGKGGVVLVALQHPERALAVVTTPGEVDRDTPDEPTGLQAAFFQKKGQHGGSGGLAVGAGDDKVPAAVEEPAPEKLRQGDKGDAVGKDGLQFGVSPGNGVPDHGKIRFRGEIFLPISLVEGDVAVAEEIGHRGVDGLI